MIYLPVIILPLVTFSIKACGAAWSFISISCLLVNEQTLCDGDFNARITMT